MTAHEAMLYAEVSIPAFFEKLAGAHVAPPDADSAQRLLNLGDIVVPAVHLFIEKQASREQQTTAHSIKSAVDAAFAVAGLTARPPQPATNAVDFLRIPKIAAAAAAYRAELLKGANEGCGPAMPGTPIARGEEEEEEEKKKRELAAAVVA